MKNIDWETEWKQSQMYCSVGGLEFSLRMEYTSHKKEQTYTLRSADGGDRWQCSSVEEANRVVRQVVSEHIDKLRAQLKEAEEYTR